MSRSKMKYNASFVGSGIVRTMTRSSRLNISPTTRATHTRDDNSAKTGGK